MKGLMQMPQFKLIIGLGNPDQQYTNTYHNVGHLFVDYLREQNPEATAEKTASYMNESGASVQKIMKRRNAQPEETLIVHDDSDLFVGDYKLSVDRGSAGHKGVQNIMDTIKSKAFWRLRVGIRPKPETTDAPREKAEEFVLKRISPADTVALNEVFARATQEITQANS